MSAIFISHSSVDNAIAIEVKARLAEQGHRSIFLDFDPEDGIPAGRSWERELYAKLRGCQAVIVLCSEHSLTSQWCFAEITLARSLGKYLFPLKVARCTIPPLLRDVQDIDLTVNPGQGYQRLWSGLQQAGLDPTDMFHWDGRRPPYPGLLAFQEQDAAIYFGRDAAIQGTIETLNRLQRFAGPRLALILGASGSGKSSLVRAGVVPRLKRDKDRWLVLEPFRPLRQPFDGLAMVFANAFNRVGVARDWKSIRDALNQAADSTDTACLLEMANDLRVAAAQREASLLLIIDQVEELLGQDTDHSASHFLRLMRETLDQMRSPFMALGTLRSDFLGALQTHEEVRNLHHEPLLLQQMAVADFARVIEGPSKVAGLELAPGLTQAMVADTATDDALPLLAFTLRELWERYGRDGGLTLEEYRDGIGGLKGAVARAAETVYAEGILSAEQERHLRKAFLSMIRIDEEGHYARRPMRWVELPEDVHGLLERFVEERLLVSRNEGTDRILEVAHEALFRSWGRLVAWLNLDREFLLWRQRLRRTLADWERTRRDEGTLLRGTPLAEAERWLAERPDDLDPDEQDFIQESVALKMREEEQEKAHQRQELAQAQALAAEQQRVAEAQTKAAKRLRQGVIGLIILVLVALGTAGYAYRQQRRAEQQTALATSRGLAAEVRNYLNKRLDLALLLSVEANRKAKTAEARQVLYAALESAGSSLFLHGFWHTLRQLTFSPDGNILAAAGTLGTLLLWDMSVTPPQSTILAGHQGDVWALVFSPDGQTLLSDDEHGTILRWDLRQTPPTRTVLGSEHGGMGVLGISTDGQQLASGDKHGQLFLWNLSETTPRPIPLPGPQTGVHALMFRPDGKTLAAVNIYKITVLAWDLSGPLPTSISLPDSQGDVKPEERRFAFDPHGRSFALGSSSGTVLHWDLGVSPPASQVLPGHLYGIGALALSADGQWLASGDGSGTVRRWDLSKTPPDSLALSGHQGGIRGLALSPDGKILASGDEKGTLFLWDLSATRPRPLALPGHQSIIERIAFSPDGTMLVSHDINNTFFLWELSTTPPVQAFRSGSRDRVHPFTFSPDGKTLATAEYEGPLLFWNLSAPRPVRNPPRGHRDDVKEFILSSDGNMLARGAIGNRPLLWDLRAPRPHSTLLPEHRRPMGALALSPDGTRLATSGGSRVLLWDLWVTPARATSLRGHQENVRRLRFSPDGQWLASSDGSSLLLWDIRVPQPRSTPLLGHLNHVLTFTFSPDSQWLASSDGSSLLLWDIHVPQPRSTPLLGDQDRVQPFTFSPDSKTLASGDAAGALLLWDLRASPPHPISLPGHRNGISRLTFSPDGQALVSGDTSILLLWNLRGMSPSSTILPDHPGYGRVLSFSPDGETLALDAEEDSLLLWDVSGRQAPISLLGHQDGVKALMFSPQSKTLVSSDGLGTVRLWDLSSRTQPRATVLPGHRTNVEAFTFSPDGTLLVVSDSDEDGTLVLWDLSVTPPMSLLLAHDQHIGGLLTFTHDSKTLATGGKEGPILWNVDFDSWPHHACRIANRNLTCEEWAMFIKDEPYRPTCENLSINQCQDSSTSKAIFE